MHHLENRRVGIVKKLDQVQTSFIGHFHGAAGCHDPDVFTVDTNDAHCVRSDIFVNARDCISLWRRVMGSASDDERPLIVPNSRSQKVNAPSPFFKTQNGLYLSKLGNSGCNCVV